MAYLGFLYEKHPNMAYVGFLQLKCPNMAYLGFVLKVAKWGVSRVFVLGVDTMV